MIEGLISRLLEEAGEEADAKSFCDTELKKSRAKQADLAAQADKHAVLTKIAALKGTPRADQPGQEEESAAVVVRVT